MYVPLETFLLRAPLLPESALGDAARAFARHPLHEAALSLASPATAAAPPSRARARTLDRYGRRAAFRATPQGLLAGVCLGRLAGVTRIATGAPTAHLAPTWQQIAALGRALLDEPDVRARARVRIAPSLHAGATEARWLGPGDPSCELREAVVDARLAALLGAAARWTPWARARRASGAGVSDDERHEEIDDWMLDLVDEGLLHTDVTPPLVGPPAADWMRARLRALGRDGDAATLEAALRALDAGDPRAGARRLGELPVSETAPAIHGVLVLRPRRAPTLARAVVRRAAELAPLLFRLQEALAPPASERLAQPAVDDALDAATEIHGAGALDLAALDAGDYGVSLDDADARARAAAPPPAPVVTVLVEAVLAAALARRPEATLDVAALAAAFTDVGAAPPPTCELFLAPTRQTRGARAGTGCLLGLHAPAGSSWGRFGAALGAPLGRALAALDVAERAARPGEESLDVSFAPSPALADLCAHPRVRRRALAVTAWSDQDDQGEDAPAPDLTSATLELVAAPGSRSPLALRDGATAAPVVPSPLTRVRSATAPAGATRLLCGWSLTRQHAPWALALGPLAALAHVPRLVLGGFVVAPASWRLPAAWRELPPTRAALARWRRAAGVPRWIQLGREDQLLAVDLADGGAIDDLARHLERRDPHEDDRAWEIWPPLGRTLDQDGRRVEAVVALVDQPEADEAAGHDTDARATRTAGRVPPPRRAPPLEAWTTHKIFGAAAHADALLVDVVGPTIAAARRAREIAGWFFLRYVDGPGRRHHLRVRVQAAGAAAAWDARLARALAPARATGAVVTVETADYHPERARWGAALPAAHAIFQSDSEAACALLAEEDARDDRAPDRLDQVVRTLDALARGLGLDLAARHALARAQRRASEGAAPLDDDLRADTDAEFRARARRLRACLSAGLAGRDAAARALRAHARRTAGAARALPPEARAAIAPTLLHLACVRLGGADRDLERRAHTFWERALEGLLRAPAPAAPSAPATRAFRRARRQAT